MKFTIFILIAVIAAFVSGYVTHSVVSTHQRTMESPDSSDDCTVSTDQIRDEMHRLAEFQTVSLQARLHSEIRTILQKELKDLIENSALVADGDAYANGDIGDNVDGGIETDTALLEAQLVAIEDANLLVDGALESGQLSFEDDLQLQALMADMPLDEAMAIRQRIGVAVNSGKLKLPIP